MCTQFDGDKVSGILLDLQATANMFKLSKRRHISTNKLS